MAATVELHRVTNPSDRRSASGATSWAHGFTWPYLVRAAANLAQATHVLHDSDVVIGDFNERNVRVTRDARVTLLDCDSMQVVDRASGYRLFCRVGRPEFTPPELINADWSTTVRQPSSDLFALAIHVYQLLLEGEHPFRGAWTGAGDKPPVPELARQGLWAHKAGGPLKPRPSAIPIGLLPDPITAMFRVAFERGAVDPAARPTADDWHQALSKLEASLIQCKADLEHFYVNTTAPVPGACTAGARPPCSARCRLPHRPRWAGDTHPRSPRPRRPTGHPCLPRPRPQFPLSSRTRDRAVVPGALTRLLAVPSSPSW